MANVQPDKFVKIAIQLVEAFAKYRIPGQEWQILWVVIRKTYGFQKKSDRISEQQFSELTGIRRPKCHKLLQSLVDKNILTKSAPQKGSKTAVTYELQKDYEKWKLLPKRGANPSTAPQKGTYNRYNTENKYNTTSFKKNLSAKSGDSTKLTTGKSKKSNPDHRRFVDYWCLLYEREKKVKYSFAHGKDGNLIKLLLKTYSYDSLCKMADQIFISNDPFIQKADTTIGILYAKRVKLAEEAQEWSFS